MIYKRGGVYWYKFKFAGVEIRESTGLTIKETARDAQDKRGWNCARVELGSRGLDAFPFSLWPGMPG